MTSPPRAWRSPALSTTDDAAIALYRSGVAALIAGAPNARADLEGAVTTDPNFFLAHVAAAAARFADGAAYALASPTGPITRAEEHHAEIVAAMCTEDRRRATDLRREHVLEYPADLLVVWTPMLRQPNSR